MKYHQLTLSERYHIEVGIHTGMRVNEIAKKLGRHRSTVFRELKRNAHMYREGYSALYSQQQYENRREKCISNYVIKGALRLWIDKKLTLKWSPEQIRGRRLIEGKSLIGVETIYRYVYRNRLEGGELWKNLRHTRRKRKKRFPSHRWPTRIPRLSAEERPLIAQERRRIGDFERDMIVGQKRLGYLLTAVDRKTKLVRLRQPKNLRSESVHRATIAALKGLKVKSLTNDNGVEFIAHQKTSKALKTKIYFTRPYASWERGTVENTNKLIRQYFPKSKNLKELTYAQIKMVEMELNNRPRKQLGFRTPQETHFKKTG